MTYTVVVTREHGMWLADVPVVPGAHTYARNLQALAREVADVIVLMADLPGDTPVEISWTFDVDDETVRRAAAVGNRRTSIAAAEAELAEQTRASVRDLAACGFSVRDIGPLVKLTPGRIAQLTRADGSTSQR